MARCCLLVLLAFVCLLHAQPVKVLSCIPIRDCHYIYNYARQLQDPNEVFEFLNLVHCGLDEDNQPKVLCKLVKEQQKCTTTLGGNGVCLPKEQCNTSIHSEWITRGHSKDNECGEDNTHVCCAERQRQAKRADFPPPGVCGYHPDGIKIYGGVQADLDEFSWMGILQYKKGNQLVQACSASLINREFVITAAHCADPAALKSEGYELDSVVLGEYNTKEAKDCVQIAEDWKWCADEPKVVAIKTVHLHPEWDFPGAQHDIALLRLNTPINYTDFIKPICLPFDGWTPHTTDHLFISGWGKSPTERRSAIKMKAIVHYTPCLYGNGGGTQVCAGGGGMDICSGDSGGPLMLGKFVNRQYFIFLGGVASFGAGRCGTAPSFYTFVPSYLGWIRSVLEE